MKLNMNKKPTTIFIDKNYLSLVPRPNETQRQSLKESIKKQGLLNPIIVSKIGKVLDGHTRFEICSELKIIPSYEVKHFKTEQEERLFVITCNLHRRQLTPFQIFELFNKERDIFLQQGHETRKQILSDVKSGKREKLTRKEQIENSTDFKIGKLMNTSVSTASRMAYIQRHATPIELEHIRNNKIGTDTLFRKIVKRRHEQGLYSKSIQLTKHYCPKCTKPLRKRKQCHVHKKFCCTKCEYGE